MRHTLIILALFAIALAAQDKKREPAWDPACGLIIDVGDRDWVFSPYLPPESEWVIFKIGYRFEGKEIWEKKIRVHQPGYSIMVTKADRQDSNALNPSGKPLLLFATMTSIQLDGREIKRHFVLRTKMP
jgi:hypothetical protein